MEYNGIEMEMEWMRYLTLDQALTLSLIEFDFEKYLTLDQVYFILLKENFLFILFVNMQSKTIKKR